MRAADPCPWCRQTPCSTTCSAGALSVRATIGVLMLAITVLAGITALVLWSVT